jgi:hypothetical protein
MTVIPRPVCPDCPRRSVIPDSIRDLPYFFFSFVPLASGFVSTV